MKIHGAAAPIASAKGVSTSANTIDSGTAIATEMTPPEIAFSQCDMRDTQGPQELSFAQHRHGGGIPRYAEQRRGHGVGDVFGDDRREEERDDARAGGTPMSITKQRQWGNDRGFICAGNQPDAGEEHSGEGRHPDCPQNGLDEFCAHLCPPFS
jgi:hypothetical protein